MNKKKLRFLRKRIFHKIRLWGAMLLGYKPNKMATIVDSIIYELRILLYVVFGLIGFYIFELITTIDEKNTPPIFVLMLKINIMIIIVIFILIIKIIMKMNTALKTQHSSAILNCAQKYCKITKIIQANKKVEKQLEEDKNHG